MYYISFYVFSLDLDQLQTKLLEYMGFFRGGKRMIQKLLSVAIATMLLLPFSTIPAYAATETKELGTFDKWIARSFMDQDKKVCFMESAPTKQEGKFGKRGTVRMIKSGEVSEVGARK